ncbi:MAG: polyhydroxyalkanoate synthesis regulator DNA-binding domain-containing protein [Polyangia bacterium]|jgi:polyhydroxyalkanoate synthesis repressor PhaR|nr:polyhydroxyalkanoate synthesis regulator DNA-binding domain-containing protein [Polyangia bacterium]
MSEPRVIKRYSNRKLYDTQHSCYVTLEQISEMIRRGEDVRILDNNTKEDLTSVTLTQIIFEEEKKRRLLPLAGLQSIIQTSGQSIEAFVNQIRDEVDQRVVKVFRRADEGSGDVEPQTGGETSADPGDFPKTMAAFREFLKKSEKRLDEWQNQVDLQVRKVMDGIHPLPRMQKDLQVALERISSLEERIRRLENKG